MNIDDMIMVSVDDHVVEPPHVFEGRLPAKYRDLAPQFVTRDDRTNAWRYDEWCGTYPGRFIPCVLPAIWDPEVCAAEVRRTAGKGARAVTFSENPSKLGWPSIHSDYWDPFWTACSDEGVVVCMHIGSSSSLVITAPDAPIDCLITPTPMNIVQAAADLVWSQVLRKFPELKVALSEGGIGWIPYFLERVDYSYERHHRWTGQDFGDKRPSEVFNEHIITCFIDDHFGVASREYLDIDRITHLNAMRLFNFDPPSVRPREECTVGALRQRAVGHDISVRSTNRSHVGAHKARATDLEVPD